jgi:hypothetical protein
MHAADVLVQNAGGLTTLEAFSAGLPVASYGCIPGHGLTNADALDEAGVAVWIRDPARLKSVVDDLVNGPLGLRQREEGLALFADSPDRGPAAEIARVLRSGQPPVIQPPAPRRRTRARRLTATTAVACAVWACAVATGVATSYEGTTLMHTLSHGLDLDLVSGHGPEGHQR